MGCEWSFTCVCKLFDTTARFRWVDCQLDALRKCRTPAALKKALTRLPRTLNETYDRILAAIDEDDKRSAISLLQWLAFSFRTISTEEAVEVLATDPDAIDEPRFDKGRRLRDPRDIIIICSSLVTITFREDSGHKSNIDHHNDRVPSIEEGEIRLAHFSVQEYLISEHLRTSTTALSCYYFNEKIAHVFIAKTCLAYLLQFDQDNGVDWNTTWSYPLSRYAANNWMGHAGWDPAGNRDDLHELTMMLLERTSTVYFNWEALYLGSKLWAKPVMDPLYVAAETGLERACRHLLQNGSDVNAFGGRYGTPLRAAASSGHIAIVQLLLEMDADVNVFNGMYASALQVAASGGHDTIVRALLEKGAEVNEQGLMYGNALQAAASEGHDAIVRLLLEKGAEVNTQGGIYGSALQAAASEGHDAIVRLLLEKGAEVNAQGVKHMSALQAAASRGHDAIVRLLIEKGADVIAQEGRYGGALQAAVANGHDAIALLLEATAAAVPNEKPRATLPGYKLVRHRPCTTHLSTSLCAHSPLNLSQGSQWIVTFSEQVPQRRVDIDLMHTLMDHNDCR
jgi:ankyrin repeat protein